jgi:hypothetical protein
MYLIQELINALVAFRDERDCQLFYDTKNLALRLSTETEEPNEWFFWNDVAASEWIYKEMIKDVMADLLPVRCF